MKQFFEEELALKFLFGCGLIFVYQIQMEELSMDPMTIITTLLGIFVQFAKDWPILASIIVVMGTLRLFLKPVMTFLHAIADATPTPKDNDALNKVESSMLWKIVNFVIDYFASIKLEKKQ